MMLLSPSWVSSASLSLSVLSEDDAVAVAAREDGGAGFGQRGLLGLETVIAVAICLPRKRKVLSFIGHLANRWAVLSSPPGRSLRDARRCLLA